MKKSFKDNPALAFITSTQEVDEKHNDTQEDTQYNVQLSRPGYVRTQGRKGHKKPRINLAFDSNELLDRIRKQAEREKKSITQLMNEAIVIYLNDHKNNE